MKAAIIGYGKMGHAVERFLQERGHEIVARIDADNQEELKGEAFASADVAIEFSQPSQAVANYRAAFEAGVPVVSGTTGWTAAMPEVKAMLESTGATLLWTSNFSIGVNLFMNLNRHLAALMERFPQYQAAMEEIHHIHKLDHPSGTAISLAEGIIASGKAYTGWTETASLDEPAPAGEVGIAHKREGEVPGTHIIRWKSPVDQITLEHKAFSRDGFALGAVMAAEWVVASGRKGLLTMQDFLQL